jgi:hypothetical protein
VYKGEIMTAIALVLRFIWELPQNTLGMIVWLILSRKIAEVEVIHKRYFFNIPNFGISLGSFIFWSRSDSAIIVISNNKEHEYGHSIQSLIFGPFYLLVVGLPSIARVFYGMIFYVITKTRWQNYYSGYPENWADQLGMKYYSLSAA